MKVKCIKDFKKTVLSVIEINFFKDKEYTVKEENNLKLLETVIGNIDFDKVKENFIILED